MSPSKRPPAVVAELGRPETPEETAERKAENSRNHRNRQTVNNLVLSLIATVAVVALIVLFVPRGQTPSAPVRRLQEHRRAGEGGRARSSADPGIAGRLELERGRTAHQDP